MKLDKMVLFGMVMIFGVVLPQAAEAYDDEGWKKLEPYIKNNFHQGKKLSQEEFDDIVEIIRQDGKVDASDSNLLYNFIRYDDMFDKQILSNEWRKIIQTINEDYVSYHKDVAQKYPELIALDTKLPQNLRWEINELVLINIGIKENLSEDEEPYEDFKETAARQLSYAGDILKELQDALSGSSYREVLTKIYDAETILLNENLKNLSER